MCGIAGIAFKPGEKADAGVLARLAAALAHRGPDGAGQFVTDHAALVHTRLAIIDLLTGDQPLFAGSSALIGNGEIYNFRELRESLPDFRFATGSDCEPPLAFHARDGMGFTENLRGMYALAIHDRAARSMTLARDPFGIKPLAMAETSLGLAFASEPAALLRTGLVPRAVRREKVEELLQLQFTTGRRSIFEGIERVAPGETLHVTHGVITARQTADVLADLPPPPAGEDEALAGLDAVLARSVELHQRSDVPYGLFLSGGIDSAAVLAMMRRLNEAPVLAYTAGFDSPSVADERDAAGETAWAAGARHERITITEPEVWAHLPAIVSAMDDPVADYAIIPTWFLAQRARRDVKVVLSGEGGDEFFAGYGRYRAAARRFPFAKPMRGRGIFDGLEVLRAPPRGWRDGIALAESDARGESRLRRAQRTDIADWLPNDLLLKLDRCLMAHGVEGRTPFVDPEVARFAFSLPDDALVGRGVGKLLLRKWLERHFPAARPFAPKQGFDVPIGAWIAGRGGRLGDLVARAPIVAEMARPERVRAIFERAGEKRCGFAAWSLLFLALWHRAHVLALPAAGDVFDTLSAM